MTESDSDATVTDLRAHATTDQGGLSWGLVALVLSLAGLVAPLVTMVAGDSVVNELYGRTVLLFGAATTATIYPAIVSVLGERGIALRFGRWALALWVLNLVLSIFAAEIHS